MSTAPDPIFEALVAAFGADVVAPPDRARWIRVRQDPERVDPRQGWKLHLTAAAPQWRALLDAVSPVLRARRCTFKVATERLLIEMNEGLCGPSQIGKFVTIYPDQDSAVDLAVALDDATRGLDGPRVPSDRRVAPNSVVSYRYGGFEGRFTQSDHGEVLPALEAPDGSLVPDLRLPKYQAPPWVTDPFEAAGHAAPPEAVGAVLAGRYHVVRTLQQTARGGVHLTIDLGDLRLCVLKRALRHADADDPSTAAGRLRREQRILDALAPDPTVPAVYGAFADGDHEYLVLEDVAGDSLEHRVMKARVEGRLPSVAELVDLGMALAGAAGAVHAHGYVHRDLKPGNVLEGPTGLRLIDLELAHHLDSSDAAVGYGTPGFVAPEHAQRGRTPALTDDVYALGATLHALATGCDPSATGRPLADRPLATLNPALDERIEGVFAKALAPNPADRYPTAQALSDALQAAGARSATGGGTLHLHRGPARTTDERARTLARGLGNALCDAAIPANGAVCWHSSHPSGPPIPTRDVNAGAAGVVLSLAELGDALRDPRHLEVLAAGVSWLRFGKRLLDGAPLAGLYVGESGVGLALLLAGHTLDDADTIEAAIAHSGFVAELPHRGPDVFNGTAGRLRFHLCLEAANPGRGGLAAACATADHLLALAHRDDDAGTVWWGEGDAPSLGYAHGTAGIADTLLDLYLWTGDARLSDAVTGAARWLVGQAVPTLRDGSGVGWPTTRGGALTGPAWCHGAGGIARFLLHAGRAGLHPDALPTAERAVRMVARGGRWFGPSLCHGLAGSIDLLVDAADVFGDDWLDEARILGHLLEKFHVEDGGRVVCGETPRTTSPDFTIGYAGLAPVWLRLADPRRPSLMSVPRFRRANLQPTTRRSSHEKRHAPNLDP